ncbi:MAG: glycosyltransferase family 4 protein, partial [Actinomycetota bacterium]|nr:glycosyltransferase family 4 protein [Actinomycetota bacterium]
LLLCVWTTSGRSRRNSRTSSATASTSFTGRTARRSRRTVTTRTPRRAARPGRDLRAVAELVRLFRRERPDIVHTHSSKAGFVGRLAARIAGVPVVVHTVHGWSFHAGMPRVARGVAVALERVAARWTWPLVVVAEADAEIGMAAGIGETSQYALVRSGVDVDRLRRPEGGRAGARLALGIPEGAPLVGTVTRLCRQKDPETLLRAARLLAELRPDARLVVVGDGPMRAEVERRVDELSLREHVLLLGRRSDVDRLLPGFDAFVLSSRWEGLPRVVVEAMAAGVPVVSTDVGGIAEAVENQVSGLLVPAGDAVALGNALVRVLGEPGLGARLRAAAWARVDEFDARRMVDGLEDLYSGLLTGVRSRPRRARMAEAVRTESDHEAA